MKTFEKSSSRIYRQQIVLMYLILALTGSLICLAYISGMAHQKALMEPNPGFTPYYNLILIAVFGLVSLYFIGQAMADTADLLKVYQDFILQQNDLMDKMIVNQKGMLEEISDIRKREEEKKED